MSIGIVNGTSILGCIIVKDAIDEISIVVNSTSNGTAKLFSMVVVKLTMGIGRVSIVDDSTTILLGEVVVKLAVGIGRISTIIDGTAIACIIAIELTILHEGIN